MTANIHSPRCVCCGERSNLSLDHIIPLCRGGRDVRENTQVMCKQCNGMKADWHPSFGGLPPCLMSQQKYALRSDFKRGKILAMMRFMCQDYPEYDAVIDKLATENGKGSISWRDVLSRVKRHIEEPRPSEAALVPVKNLAGQVVVTHECWPIKYGYDEASGLIECGEPKFNVPDYFAILANKESAPTKDGASE